MLRARASSPNSNILAPLFADGAGFVEDLLAPSRSRETDHRCPRIYDQNIASSAQFRYHFVVQLAPVAWTIHHKRLMFDNVAL